MELNLSMHLWLCTYELGKVPAVEVTMNVKTHLSGFDYLASVFASATEQKRDGRLTIDACWPIRRMHPGLIGLAGDYHENSCSITKKM